jgi:hypothetical protein
VRREVVDMGADGRMAAPRDTPTPKESAMSPFAAIMLVAFAQTPISNGDNANQVRSSIYDIVQENTLRTAPPSTRPPAGTVPMHRVRTRR